MKIATHSKAISSGQTNLKNSSREAYTPSKMAIAKAEAYLARSQKEFINTVETARDSLARNEAGPLAGRAKSRFK